MHYAVLLHLHVTAVVLSGGLFLIRGSAMLAGADWHQRGLWRVVPHVVDSVLLAAAVGLLVVLHGQPLGQPWLYAKLIALPAYVIAGSIALKRGRSTGQRRTAFVAALLIFTYIVGVALSRSTTWWVST
ncbi:SirB2 family protein [Algiphilus sp.]|uniref:SirB2 family protein n=1 Tax=Algiphilus sp. TaxID=1872431 RepID=UPI003B5243B8